MENVAEIEQLIKARFETCARLPNGLLRCERIYKKTPWAVVLFDTSGQIPETSELLNDYLDKNIAKSYFATSPPYLRWNHYLVFLHDPNDKVGDRGFVERDTNYARKYLVSTAQLPEYLRGYQADDPMDLAAGDVFGRWAEILDTSGLGAVVDEKPRATLVQEFLASDALPSATPRASMAQAHPEDAIYGSYLEELRIRSFLPLPPPGPYSFGIVNLIVGPNGVGKTSLLEAIEHFYCGATLRSNLESLWSADLQAQFRGVPQTISSESETEAFRKRDLRWYGRNYDRLNKLPESFNRYNFFNSDAAYKFVYEGGSESLREALSRLALGDAANRLWDRVVKTKKLFDDEKKSAFRESTELQTQLLLTRREIEQVQAPSPLVQVLFGRLNEHFASLLWKSAPSSLQEITPEFIKTFQSVSEDIHLLARLAWLDGVLTRKRIEQELAATARAAEQTKQLQKRIAEGRQLLARLDSENRVLVSRREEMLRLKQYVDTGFAELYARARALGESARIRSIIPTATAVLGTTAVTLPEDEPLPHVRERVHKTRATVRAEQSALKKKLKDAEGAANEAANALASIRSLAMEILSRQPNRTDCPVCRTKFESSEVLRRHVQAPDVEGDVQALQEIALQVQNSHAVVERVEEQLLYLENCFSLLIAIGLDVEKETIVSARLRASQICSDYEGVLRENSEVERQLTALTSAGMSIEEFEALRKLVSSGLFDRPSSTMDSRERLFAEVEQQSKLVADSIEKLGGARRELENVQQEWRLLTSQWSSGSTEEEVLHDVEQKLSSLETVASALQRAGESIELDGAGDLKELLLRIQVTRDVLDELVGTVEIDRKRNLRLVDLLAKRQSLEDKIAIAHVRNARCDKALAALGFIVEQDSREKAVGEFLTRNEREITNVFARIHAPTEFRGFSEDGRSLIALDGRARSFRQISTGQRSAVAISVFLTLNAMLQKAPPILIFDDPVATVDDLNTLAFLDHLRDLVISGRRQIFFATANEKLCSLFTKKFEFLGDKEFKTHSLARPN